VWHDERGNTLRVIFSRHFYFLYGLIEQLIYRTGFIGKNRGENPRVPAAVAADCESLTFSDKFLTLVT
jgi:hypothetical protein